MLELSGIEIIPLISEIGDSLRRTYVNNVFSIGDNQVVRFRLTDGPDRLLVLSPRSGAWLSTKVAERTETTEFTSRLRSQIERLRFAEVKQVDLDRVYDITLGEGETLRHLILELMPPGNIVVTDQAYKILIALREAKSGRRPVRRGDRYSPPAQTRLSPDDATPESVGALLTKEKTLGAALGRQVALPRKYVREVLGVVGLSETSKPADAVKDAGRIAGAIKGIVDGARHSPNPCVAKTPEAEELFAVAPKTYEVTRTSRTMSSLCDETFTGPMLSEITEEPTQEDQWRRENEITVSRLKEREAKLVERARALRAAALRARDSSSAKEALEVFASEVPEAAKVRRPPGSAEAVASALFSLAKESEAKASESRSAAEALSKKTPPRGIAERKRTSRLSTRKGEWYEKFRWFTTSGGRLAIGGRDAQSNTLLIRRHLEPNDTVYHADLFGSPFFILKQGVDQTPEETLELGAATVSFSSGWKTGLGSADAYWVTREQIGTSAPSGEYLARGSFMIKGKKNNLPHLLLELALGLDGTGRVVAGPESAVAAACQGYVVIQPHREKASETAKKIAHELKRLTGGEQGPTVDEVLRALPAGGGKLVRTKSRLAEDKRK